MNTEFSKLFQNFTMIEFDALTDYFNSAYFKIPKRLVKLHKLVFQNLTKYNKVNLCREDINNCFYPGSNVKENYVNIRKLFSEYKYRVNEFYSYFELSSDVITKGKLSLNWYQRKIDKNEFQKQFSKLKETIETNSEKDDTYYLEMHQLYSRRYNYFDSNINQLHNDNSNYVNNYLDKFYIANKLFLFQRFTSYEYSNRIDLEHFFTLSHCVYEFIEKHKQDIFKNDPEITFRYLAIELQKKGLNLDIYKEYVDYLKKIDPNIKINENDYYLTLLHTLSKIINEGHMEFLHHPEPGSLPG